MILYDQNYNFLGISNETVSFLGYEDIEEFTSLHSDFANLLVPKDGLIYKFKNFSWIDFILYSGAPNKAAIVKLKNGEEVEIKLTVKEIFFAKEFHGLEKCYGVRIISDKFVHIASKVDASIKSEAKSGVNLSSLISDTQTKPAKEIEENSIAKEEKEDEIVLNFNSFSTPTQEAKESSLTEEESVLPTTKDDTNKIVLDLTSKEEEKSEDNKQKNSFNLNFLDAQKKDETTEEDVKKEEKKENSLINLNFLKSTKDDDSRDEDKKDDNQDITSQTKKLTPSLDFLKLGKKDDEEDMVEINRTNLQNEIKSDFVLKFKEDTNQEESTQDIKDNSITKDVDHNIDNQQTNNTTTKDKDEIIKQIKDDISIIDNDNETEQQEHNQNSFKHTLSSINTTTKDKDENSNLIPSSFTREKFIDNGEIKEQQTVVNDLEEDEDNDDLIFDFIYDSKSNITLLKSFLFDENYKKALYPITKMKTSADILNLNDIISTLNSIQDSTKSKDKESILNHIHILEKKLNILKSKIKGEAAFS